ncbi:HepT-like ribonuclease domain-containing protein [Neorhizobium sp. SHOUNA12B]|uniref:HepT-like ribonuclease domain-containing protein n=1 Tax=Neorhizobium sp. SHOUNA12B TaxID=2908928 RepID=UPI00344CF007
MKFWKPSKAFKFTRPEKSLAEFERDWLLRLGTQRALEIISEACRNIPGELLNLAPDVPRLLSQAYGPLRPI